MNVDGEQITPFSLPAMKLEQRDELPEVGGFYFVLKEDVATLKIVACNT